MSAVALRTRALATVILASLLVPLVTSVEADASPLRSETTVMADSVPLSQAEVLAWFRSLSSRPAYRASVPDAELVRLFAQEGEQEGVHWNVAFAQAILETAWFNYPSYGQVRPEDNNFGGMGAYDGTAGQFVFQFETAELGVRAKMQHLRIYGDATIDTEGDNLGSPLAEDIELDYPDRWKLVRQGVDPTGIAYHASALHWEQLGNGLWATDPFYACKILTLYRRMLEFNGRDAGDLPTNPTCLRTWHERLTNTGGPADQFAFLGRPGDTVLACDFSGDGRDTPATFRDGYWTISNQANGSGPFTFTYGRAGDLPLCGDWDGDGQATVGIVRDGRWHLRNTLAGGIADIEFTYGRVTQGDIPIVGDWDGNGRDTPGIIRDGAWHLRNRLSGGAGDLVFTYGRILAGDRPLVGDWNADGRDGIGIARDSTREWHLRDSLSGGPAQLVFVYGRLGAGDVAVVGDWNRDGRSTPAIVRE